MSGIKIPKSPYVLGIDLGTTNSSAAIFSGNDIITLKIGVQNLTMPSVVWFSDGKRENVKHGQQAKQKIFTNPEHVFTSVKSLMRDDEWKNDLELNKKFIIDGEELSPTTIATEILRKIKERALEQSDFDLDGDIQEIVICIPANTTDFYRNNIYKAAIAAGLGLKDDNGDVLMDGDKPKGVWLLEEPSAAALAYAHENGFTNEDVNKEQSILVYDFGGGTFDVSILNLDATGNSPKYSVVTTRGVAKLGGDDLDMCIIEMVAQEFKDHTNINILDSKSDNEGTSSKIIKEALQKLKESAEDAKIELASGSKEAEINITDWFKDGEGKVHHIEFILKSNDFLDKISSLLTESQECVNNALSDANMKIDDIGRVILVGGSTKGPWIKDAVEKLGKTPYVSDNVDVIVAKGAAYYGHLKKQLIDNEAESGESSEVLESVTSHHLGISTSGNAFSLVIEKDMPIDADGISITKRFFNPDQQDSVMISIFKSQNIEVEGEANGKIPTRKYFVNEKKENGTKLFECIGDFILKGIPRAEKGTEPVDVTMKIDGQDQRLHVSAVIANTGEATEVKVNL